MVISSHGNVHSSMMKKIKVTSIGAFCGYLTYSFLTHSQLNGELWSNSILLEYLIAMLIGVANAWGIMMINSWFNRRFPWKKGVLLRLILGYFTQGIFVIAISTVLTLGALFWFNGSSTFQDLITQYNAEFIKLCIVIVLGLIVYNVIYFALFSYHEFSVTQIEMLENERKQLELQLEALKSQLRPHYLFNSLNTISSLLYKDAKLTENFIRRLAETYKYILSTHQHQYVSLSEEIEFVKSYHFLLKVRFEENIFLEINMPPTLMDTKIPPLTMQILVENAIKHNVITQKNPLYIYISAIDDTILKVMNTKTQSPIHTTSFNIGLKNIKKRYDMLSDHKVTIINETKFAVHLPVIKKPHSLSA